MSYKSYKLYMKIITHTEQETIELGTKLARELRGGEVICLYGDLGAGKTTLVKGIAQGLGIKKIITSPTFILMNIYKIKDVRFKIKELVHIDCYRVHRPEDIENIGALEYFGRKDSVVVIEWPEKIKEILPKKKLKIRITFQERNKRILAIH